MRNLAIWILSGLVAIGIQGRYLSDDVQTHDTARLLVIPNLPVQDDPGRQSKIDTYRPEKSAIQKRTNVKVKSSGKPEKLTGVGSKGASSSGIVHTNKPVFKSRGTASTAKGPVAGNPARKVAESQRAIPKFGEPRHELVAELTLDYLQTTKAKEHMDKRVQYAVQAFDWDQRQKANRKMSLLHHMEGNYKAADRNEARKNWKIGMKRIAQHKGKLEKAKADGDVETVEAMRKAGIESRWDP